VGGSMLWRKLVHRDMRIRGDICRGVRDDPLVVWPPHPSLGWSRLAALARPRRSRVLVIIFRPRWQRWCRCEREQQPGRVDREFLQEDAARGGGV